VVVEPDHCGARHEFVVGLCDRQRAALACRVERTARLRRRGYQAYPRNLRRNAEAIRRPPVAGAAVHVDPQVFQSVQAGESLVEQPRCGWRSPRQSSTAEGAAKPQVPQDLLDDLRIFDASDDPHRTPAAITLLIRITVAAQPLKHFPNVRRPDARGVYYGAARRARRSTDQGFKPLYDWSAPSHGGIRRCASALR
jgi:hypothetical protein